MKDVTPEQNLDKSKEILDKEITNKRNLSEKLKAEFVRLDAEIATLTEASKQFEVATEVLKQAKKPFDKDKTDLNVEEVKEIKEKSGELKIKPVF